jgi:hypothetical protein
MAYALSIPRTRLAYRKPELDRLGGIGVIWADATTSTNDPLAKGWTAWGMKV